MSEGGERGAATAGTMILRDGRIVYASGGIAALAGRPVDELLGRLALDLYVPADAARLREVRARDLRGEPVPRTLEASLLLPGGGRRPVEIHVDLDGPETIVHVRDRGAQAARRLRLDAVAAVGAAIRSERSEEAVHARAREELERLGLASALMRAEGGRAEVVWFSVSPGVREAVLAATGRAPDALEGPLTPFAREVLAEGAAFTDDWGGAVGAFFPPDQAEAARTLVAREGFSRAAGVRIDQPGRGDLYLVVAGSWLRGDDVPAVRLFGAQVAAALDAARTIADLSRRNADLDVLARVAALASEATDLPAFFGAASRVLRSAIGHGGLAVYVLDEPTGELALTYDDGGHPELAARWGRLRAGSRLAEVLLTRTPRIVPAPFERDEPVLAALGIGALAWIPLVARSRPIGVLVAAFPGGPAAAHAATDLLLATGAHVASAIESHRLVADLRRRVSELTLLVDVARASAQLDPVLLLEAGLRRICDTVGADLAAAYLRDAGRLVLLSATGLDLEGTRAVAELPAQEGPGGLAIARRAPVTGRGDELGAPPVRTAAGDAIGPCVAVPLLAKADAVGAIVLGRVAETPWTEGDIALLASIGVQLGVAVDAARLFSDVRRRLADLEAVHALALRVFANAPGDAPALLQDGCREILSALSARGAAVFLPGGDGLLRLAAGAGVPEELRGVTIDLAADAFSAEVVRTRAPALTDDITRDPRSALRGNPAVPPLAMLAVPLGSREEVRGLVYVADLAGRRFSPADVALANALAGALGLGVENAGLYAEARRRVEELSLLNEAGRTIAGSLDVAEVVRAAAEATRRLVEAGRAWVLLHDGARAEIRFGAGDGPVNSLAGVAGPVPEGSLIEQVLSARRTLVVEDLSATPAGDAHRARFGGRSLLAVPVVLRGDPLGILLVDDERRRRFGDSDVEHATAIADRLAVALENARLYGETRRRAEELGLLHAVGRSLVQTLDIEQVLSAGIRNLARIVDAPEAYLALVTEDGTELELRAVAGGPLRRVGERIPVERPGSALANLVYATREPIVVADALRDPRVSEEIRTRSGARAFLGLPLVARDQVVGTAVIVETKGPRLFTPPEVERAAAIANQLAVAVDNARLYERLRLSYRELERAQQQLLAGERLAALGELSAIVAHEVRNPLGVIFNSLGPLRRLLQPRGDARMLFDIVEEEAERLNRMVGDLLDFARPSTPEVRREDLGHVVDEAVTAAVGQGGADRIEIVRELDPDVPPVAIDARLVRQAVVNVAVNAVQAMPRGGRITIRTRRDGEAVLVELEDTGGGIPEEVRGRIFEPFFTTKASGTGLGLAVVKRILDGHGGTISVHSQPLVGTVFSLRFPLGGPAVENGPVMG